MALVPARAGRYCTRRDDTERLRAVALGRRYADLDLGFVDAAVIAVCESLGETKVATLDRRHFGVVRPAHCERLRLLPEIGA